MSRPDGPAQDYLAVIHLTDEAAARKLGKTLQVVREYRARRPDLAYRPAPVTTNTRPGIVTLAIPRHDPFRSAGEREVRMVRVSLPAPPPGLNISFGNREVSI